MPDEGLVSSDAFMPDEGLVDSVASRLVGAADGAARSDDGALCWTVEPDGASRLPPVPCAFAKPVPAINAAAATEIIKRLVMEFSPHLLALPAPTTKGDDRGSVVFRVPSSLFRE